MLCSRDCMLCSIAKCRRIKCHRARIRNLRCLGMGLRAHSQYLALTRGWGFRCRLDCGRWLGCTFLWWWRWWYGSQLHWWWRCSSRDCGRWLSCTFLWWWRWWYDSQLPWWWSTVCAWLHEVMRLRTRQVLLLSMLCSSVRRYRSGFGMLCSSARRCGANPRTHIFCNH